LKKVYLGLGYVMGRIKAALYFAVWVWFSPQYVLAAPIVIEIEGTFADLGEYEDVADYLPFISEGDPWSAVIVIDDAVADTNNEDWVGWYYPATSSSFSFGGFVITEPEDSGITIWNNEPLSINGYDTLIPHQG